MSDWEENDPDKISIRVAKPSKWNDEDAEEEDVKENWEESSDEEKENAKSTTTPAAPLKKKISAAQKAIAKREKMNNNDDNEEEDELDESERRKRERQAIIDADLENAKGMFQGIALKETEVDKVNSKNLNVEKMSQGVTTKGSQLDTINPRTKEEFSKFSKLLVDRIRKHEKQGTTYVNFINEFVRELCLPLKDVDVRKVASSLTTLANEKQKQIREKDKPKKKGNTKPVLQVEKFDSVDITDYGDYANYDDYDDFI